MKGSVIFVVIGTLTFLNIPLSDQSDLIYTAVTLSEISSNKELPIYTTLHSGSDFPAKFRFKLKVQAIMFSDCFSFFN